ncbi:MAG: hypothetical protein V1740_03490 [Candidatus Woesearchaeota archaeon]
MVKSNLRDGYVLRELPASDFRSVQVRVNRSVDSVALADHGLHMDFGAMSRLRQEVDPEQMQESLDSIEGHLFANVGVSAAIDFFYGSTHFAVAVAQERPDFDDHVLKLISGYSDATLTYLQSLINELAEEVLPVKGGKVITRTHDFRARCHQLPKPYDGRAEYEYGVHLTPGSRPKYLPSLDPKPIETLDDLNVAIMYDALHNSANLVFPVNYKIIGNKIVLTLAHAEDQPPVDGIVQTLYNQEGLVLLEMDDKGSLTGKTWRLVDGHLKIGPDKIKVRLSEAFAWPAENTVVVNQPSIGFEEYLERME